jgi:holo-[acyl-carrier protein] synthase
MSISSIGVDIESIDRFRSLPYQENINFYDKIFTKEEIVYCTSKSDPYPHFAVRFCAKEAVIKALNDTDMSPDMKNIEIINSDGAPQVRILGRDDFSVLASFSHTDKYAVAFVTLANI